MNENKNNNKNELKYTEMNKNELKWAETKQRKNKMNKNEPT